MADPKPKNAPEPTKPAAGALHSRGLASSLTTAGDKLAELCPDAKRADIDAAVLTMVHAAADYYAARSGA